MQLSEETKKRAAELRKWRLNQPRSTSEEARKQCEASKRTKAVFSSVKPVAKISMKPVDRLDD